MAITTFQGGGPAGYQPENLHFEADPYATASLYDREDDTQCLVSPQYKVFAFDADQKWQNNQPFQKRQKLTTPSQYAKRKIDATMNHAAKIPFSTMMGRT